MSNNVELWRAVILQAIDDATRDKPVACNAANPIADRDAARAWLTSDGADFAQVCALAELDHDAVRLFAAKQIETAADHEPTDGAPRRAGRRITFNGQGKTVTEWAEGLGLSVQSLRQRLHDGWTVERALTTPPMNTKRKSTPRGTSKTFRESALTGDAVTRENSSNWGL
jgi:hypothetical protein